MSLLLSVLIQAQPIHERISQRDFPSIFQAWNPAENLAEESKEQTEARHDLLFHAADFFHLKWNAEKVGEAIGFTKTSLMKGMKRREELLELNPNMLLLCEIRYRDAHHSFLSDESKWWAKNDKGERIVGWEEGGYFLLDFSNEDFQNHIAKRAKAAVESGVFDGVFLDWWVEDDDRLALAEKVREAIGDNTLILVNANDRKSPRTAHLINGHFMECYRSATKEDWSRIEDALLWAESHLREPRINCLEIWFADSRKNLNLMRAATTLGLTRSDGYVLFADPNPLPTPDHLHDWYTFWDVDMGKPLEKGKQREDGSVLREFSHGYALYNPPGKMTKITFNSPHKRFSTGGIALDHKVGSLDGDLFIKEK